MELKIFKNYQDVLDAIEQEGEGYFVLHYTSADKMPDEQGVRLFKQAESALRKFVFYVQNHIDNSNM